MTQKRGWLFVASLATLTFAACSLGDGVDELQGGAAAAGAAGQGSSGGGGGGSGRAGGGAGGSSAGTSGSNTGGSGTGGSGTGGSAGSQSGGSAGGGGMGTGGGGSGKGGSGGIIVPDCGAGEGVFCDNFEGQTPGATWTDTETTGIGMSLGALAPGNGTPQALLATAAPRPDEVERRARLLQSFAAPTLVQCSADLFIVEYNNENVALLEFKIERPGFGEYRTTFTVNGDQAGLEIFTETVLGEVVFDRRNVGLPPVGAWSRVALEISATDGARLFYDGFNIAQLDLALTDVTEATFSLGIVSVGASGSISFGFDELSCSFN